MKLISMMSYLVQVRYTHTHKVLYSTGTLKNKWRYDNNKYRRKTETLDIIIAKTAAALNNVRVLD